MSRGRYEFLERTKDTARQNWHAKNPGRPNEVLEINHKIPVHVAKKLGIPPDLVRTQNNAEALTKPDHLDFHKNELTVEEYKTLAQSILGWVRNLI
jgi:hypothetical protein